MELEAICKDLEHQLKVMKEDKTQEQEELAKELEIMRRKQAKLDDLLCNLEKQRKRLSLTQIEVHRFLDHNYVCINGLFY